MPTDESREPNETPQETTQESGAADINTMKNRQNSEKGRHPDKCDDKALRNMKGGMVYEYGTGIMPPRPDGIIFPEEDRQ